MTRGDLVTVAISGAYGKPQPAVVVQANTYLALGSVTFLPLTTEILPHQVFRVSVAATTANCLRAESQVMADKCTTLPVSKIGKVFGRLDDADMDRVNRALAVFLGFA